VARPKVDKHQTAEVILHSALHHFLEKGFEGTSINDVADTAKINKSLIYHHFGNKIELWKAVKNRIVEQAMAGATTNLNFYQSTLKDFLNIFIPFRVKVYAQNPELIRLMGWQRLEPQIESAGGGGVTLVDYDLSKLRDHIQLLQSTGEIRDDLKPDMIFYVIYSLASNGFIDNQPFLKTKQGQADYQKFLIETLYMIFKGKKSL
jgi:AcrR family transcriptional regulator